jgi:hypothetical protein
VPTLVKEGIKFVFNASSGTNVDLFDIRHANIVQVRALKHIITKPMDGILPNKRISVVKFLTVNHEISLHY